MEPEINLQNFMILEHATVVSRIIISRAKYSLDTNMKMGGELGGYSHLKNAQSTMTLYGKSEHHITAGRNLIEI